MYDVTANASRTLPIGGRVGAIVPSSEGTRLYGVDAMSGFLRSLNPMSGAELGAVPVTGGANGTGRILRWGTDGVVYASDGSIMYVRADFIR